MKHFDNIVTNEMKYGILFGPLALVNTARNIPFGFTHHLNLDGTDACWRITHRFGEVLEDLGEVVSTIYNHHQLLVNQEDEDEDGEFYQPVQMGEHDRFQVVHMNFALNEKIIFFTKVFASCKSTYLFVNKSYLKDFLQELFVCE